MNRPAKPRSSTNARFIKLVRFSTDRLLSVTRRDLDNRGEITENDGFSVVAATNVTDPFSTPGRSASCCALLNLCTSSIKRTVWVLYKDLFCAAAVITSRTSFTPADTADNSTNFAWPLFAINCAIVVLPVPGGPHRITDVTG